METKKSDVDHERDYFLRIIKEEFARKEVAILNETNVNEDLDTKSGLPCHESFTSNYSNEEESVIIKNAIDSRYISDKYYKGDHDKVVGLMKSFECLYVLVSKQKEKVVYILTNEGENYRKKGSPEYQVTSFVIEKINEMKKDQGDKMSELLHFDIETSIIQQHFKDSNIFNLGLSNALRNKWLEYGDNSKKVKLGCEATKMIDEVRIVLDALLIMNNNSEENEDTNANKTDRMDPLLDIVFKYNELIGDKNDKNTINRKFPNNPQDYLKELKKRKLINMRKMKYFLMKKGPKFDEKIKQKISDISQKIILDNSWKTCEFKPYNFYAGGIKPTKGSINRLNRIMRHFKVVLNNMGFQELKTNQWVESSFWCFDALYVPQQHPARDSQDTFFLKVPEFAREDLMSKEYVDIIKSTHEVGIDESFGWNYKWSRMESDRCILRTHTTAVTSRVLCSVGNEYKKSGALTSQKYFSIDRVFRNETVDATHLVEFHQVEGIVIGEKLGLGHLKGLMKCFYSQLGLKDLRFKPTYNPFTEPSLEVYGFHPILNKWIEVGNSGIFRPEVVCPSGLPKTATIIGWGLSLERPTMIRYGIKNIRDIFGYKSSIE